MRLEDLLDDRSVVVCAGAGGVGKTTSSAAIAMGLAERGRAVLVLTIDPARRLATALGLPERGGEAQAVDLAALGLDARGSMHAMMLDARGTFDALVAEHAPSAEAAARILENRIYRELSTAVAGSHEYMAMEKLYELHRAGGYDVIVLDTPPSRNALDFLEAPARLTRFIEGKALRFLLRPGVRAGRLGFRALGAGSSVALGLLERLTGMTLLQDLSEFVSGFDGMYEGFAQRARDVSALLCSQATVFLLVTVPEEEPIAEVDFFWRALVERGLPFGGVVVNKVHPTHLAGHRSHGHLREEAERELGGAGAPAAVAARAAENLLHYEALAARDRANIERLVQRIGAGPLLEIPYLDHDVHDLAGLREVARYLFATRAGERAAH